MKMLKIDIYIILEFEFDNFYSKIGMNCVLECVNKLNYIWMFILLIITYQMLLP